MPIILVEVKKLTYVRSAEKKSAKGKGLSNLLSNLIVLTMEHLGHFPTRNAGGQTKKGDKTMTHRIKKALTSAARNLIFRHPAARVARRAARVIKRGGKRQARKTTRKGRK